MLEPILDMPSLKCPQCKRVGRTGLVLDPAAQIVVGPQVYGTTKSVLYCRACSTPFAKGPFGRGVVIGPVEWWQVSDHPLFQGLSDGTIRPEASANTMETVKPISPTELGSYSPPASAELLTRQAGTFSPDTADRLVENAFIHSLSTLVPELTGDETTKHRDALNTSILRVQTAVKSVLRDASLEEAVSAVHPHAQDAALAYCAILLEVSRAGVFQGDDLFLNLASPAGIHLYERIENTELPDGLPRMDEFLALLDAAWRVVEAAETDRKNPPILSDEGVLSILSTLKSLGPSSTHALIFAAGIPRVYDTTLRYQLELRGLIYRQADGRWCVTQKGSASVEAGRV